MEREVWIKRKKSNEKKEKLLRAYDVRVEMPLKEGESSFMEYFKKRREKKLYEQIGELKLKYRFWAINIP